jgi:hypothetical protein
MRPLLLAVTLGIGPSVVAMSAEQSLADVARKAEADRNATSDRPPAKVYTDKDLRAVAPVPPPPTAKNATSSTPATSSADKLPSGAKDEVYWRDRMRPLRERLDSTRALADKTKRQAEALMRAADRCFAVGIVCEDYTESLRLTDEHKALSADVARAERDVAALEEEARQAGVPPGWLRE